MYDYHNALFELIKTVRSYYPGFNSALESDITRAFWYGKEAHNGQFRKAGEDYFTHCIEATMILLTIKPDVDTIIACLLHDVIEDVEHIHADDIEREFGTTVRFICEGVEKVSKVRTPKGELKGTNDAKYETYRKLFIAMASDIRVIFVKLSDRLHNMRTLRHVSPEKRERIALETQQIYAPIAGQLGLNTFKEELDDLCFEYLHTDEYTHLKHDMDLLYPKYKTFLDHATADLEALLHDKRVPYIKIYGRIKNLASIYEKLHRKNLTSVRDMYDVVGIRIIVKSNDTCYKALGALHSIYTPMPGRFKDYIAAPKTNGYKSLHTTLLGLSMSTFPTEIQIRTDKMHSDAELGPAAHWAYKAKKGSNFDKGYTATHAWIRESITDNASPEDFYEYLRYQILSGRIHVFTPKGDVKALPTGATTVDFAYAVHTKIGDTIVGGKINGVLKPVSTVLKDGDIVEILTKEGKLPNPEWLDFVKTHHAKARIGSIMRRLQEEQKDDYKPTNKPVEKVIDKQIIGHKSGKMPVIKPISTDKNTPKTVYIGGIDAIPYRLATCCKPCFEDDMLGYKGRGMEYTLHKKSCEELLYLDTERFMDVWVE